MANRAIKTERKRQNAVKGIRLRLMNTKQKYELRKENKALWCLLRQTSSLNSYNSSSAR